MRKQKLLPIALLMFTAWICNGVAARANTLDLKDFGAVGDGVTDAGPALQRALDALAVAGGGTLFVPEGRYAIITPVYRDFTGFASSISILGVESSTMVDNTGAGETLSFGLDLVSEFLPRTGESAIALSIVGLQNFQIKDISFMGTPGVVTDAMVTLALDTIENATIDHCEFYGLISSAQDGAIILAQRSRLKIDQSKFLGCSGNSGIYVPVVQNLRWKSITVSNTSFLDYGQRAELFGKLDHGAPLSWINIGNAEAPGSDSPRREVFINNVFLDEGAYFGISSLPHLYQPSSAPIDLVYITGLRMNVTNLGASGNYLNDIRAVLIERSRYEWSSNAFAAISLHNVETAILDEVECLDGANRIFADSTTGKLTVINSVYTHLDSEAQTTDVINTDTTEDYSAKFVRQQFETLLQRPPDPAGHYYWSNRMLECGDNADCLGDRVTEFEEYLASEPAARFAIVGTVLGEDGYPMPNVTVALSGSQSVVTQTDADGRYRFTGLPTSGEHEVSASKAHYSFSQPSLSFRTPSGDQTAAFVGSLNSHTIAGRVTTTNGTSVSRVRVVLSGSQSATAFTNDTGDYSFADLTAGGNYKVELTQTHYSFEPATRTFDNLDADPIADFISILNSHKISGRVMTPDGQGISGVAMKLSGQQTVTTLTSSTGDYSFPAVPAGGNYSLAPSQTHYTFQPSSLAFDDLSEDQNVGFIGTLNRHTISGRVTKADGSGVAGVTVGLSGAQSASTQTNSGGDYSFTGLSASGTYTVTVSKVNYVFNPHNRTWNDLAANEVANFTGTPNYQISGRLTQNGTGLGGVTLILSGSQTGVVESGVDGSYSFTVPAEGSYTVTPSSAKYAFKPTNVVVNNMSGNATGNFAATRVRVGIGHLGGGQHDDPGAVATPRRPHQ